MTRRMLQQRKCSTEAADPVFCALLKQSSSGPRRRRAFELLVGYVGAVEVGADADGMQRLVSYLLSARDYLDQRDASFVSSMAKIVQRYAPTPKQRKWLLDILYRLERFRRDRIGQKLEQR